MLRSVGEFVSYFESIRRRTLVSINTLPADRLDWRPRDSEFSCRDLILHLAAAESMFCGVFTSGKWKYHEPHGEHVEATLEQLIAHLADVHAANMTAVRAMPDDTLDQPRQTLEGPNTIKAWRTLMMLVEHEVHHRSQLAMYLALMGVEPPQIYGLGVEDVIARATG